MFCRDLLPKGAWSGTRLWGLVSGTRVEGWGFRDSLRVRFLWGLAIFLGIQPHVKSLGSFYMGLYPQCKVTPVILHGVVSPESLSCNLTGCEPFDACQRVRVQGAG